MTKLLIRLFVKNSEDVLNPAVRRSYGSLSGGVGIFCNLFLCIIKIAVGFLTASISITADGLNNLSDMGSSVITLIGFKMAASLPIRTTRSATAEWSICLLLLWRCLYCLWERSC